jgi:uncharacterized membrane protein YphA (DoxX/SURF4 family)
MGLPAIIVYLVIAVEFLGPIALVLGVYAVGVALALVIAGSGRIAVLPKT